ncbi:hypothetical protein [Pseudomonas yamanorum]|uniref:hypothetical protein n=1 Tax=Pseudomonas yamanorum TaxID=515393 RepID=UPI003D36533B
MSLENITGSFSSDRAISALGFARFHNCYDPALLRNILDEALKFESIANNKFLSLKHLRKAHIHIPQIESLMLDKHRLEYLSQLADCELEAYPIPTAASHINYYRRGQPAIGYHTDGAAMVELIPLYIDGPKAKTATLIYKGSASDRSSFGEGQTPFSKDDVIRVPQEVGISVLLQGRCLLHAAEMNCESERITLVLVLRSKHQPWKDDNTLFRLLQDDLPEDVVQPWVEDVVSRQYPAYSKARTNHS